jgi:uncharacterized cupredoxin-like copper-binding protein
MCLNASFKDGGKIKPHNFSSKGGKVSRKHKNIPAKLLHKHDPDQVLARLSAGEIVIPRKHVKKVETFLKAKKIKLPGM